MNILALCCALDKSYIALEYEGRVTTKTIKNDENYHSLYVLSELKNMKIDFSKLDCLAVNTGVGSFSGIRVALTIIKTIAHQKNLPIVPLATAEILLTYFKKDLLLMDARRDMYFLGDMKETKLISKDSIEEYIKDKTIVSDKRCMELRDDFLCFEDTDMDIGETMLCLAKEKYNSIQDKTIFHHTKISANYIQTPPIFGV